MAGIANLAQVNIGRLRVPLESPELTDFVARVDEINALADRSHGFVWRLQGAAGNATYVRAYDDERILFNMSVWEDFESLRAYVYGSAHKELLRRRSEWFTRFKGVYTALWWVPVGHRPSVGEAKKRLAHLEQHGPTAHAFTFQHSFPPDAGLLRSDDLAAVSALHVVTTRLPNKEMKLTRGGE